VSLVCSKLRSKPNLRQLLEEFLGDFDELEEREITWSLHDFSFQKNAFHFTDVTLPQNDSVIDDESDHDDAPIFGGDVDMPVDEPPTVQDFFSGDQGGIDDYVGGDDGFPPEDHEGGMDDRSGPLVNFDPRKATNHRELVVTMQKDGEAGMLDYFDSNIFRNWAGPEHWKLRRTFPKKGVNANNFQMILNFVSNRLLFS
jgi:condensin complex subunit 2